MHCSTYLHPVLKSRRKRLLVHHKHAFSRGRAIKGAEGFHGLVQGVDDPAALRLHENGQTLLDRLFGFCTNDFVIVVRNRMSDNGKGKARHTRDLCHGLGRLPEAIRNNGRGRNASFFRRDSIVQTARRATPSIPYRGNHCGALLHVDHDLRGRRAAGIRLPQAENTGHSVA